MSNFCNARVLDVGGILNNGACHKQIHRIYPYQEPSELDAEPVLRELLGLLP